jgi:antirestriction protein ArdC
VRKGEKSSRIEVFKDELIEDEETGDKKRRVVARHYPVFNAQQIDGIPKIVLPKKEKWEAIQAGERIMRTSGADIRYGGTSAYYSPFHDYIQLPNKEDFFNASWFYSTASHELGHWTGHPSRLNRLSLTAANGNKNTEEYAREELVAELASLFLSMKTGLPHNPERHAAYISSWLRALKKDKNELFRAASAASKATDYLLQVKKKKTNSALTAAA